MINSIFIFIVESKLRKAAFIFLFFCFQASLQYIFFMSQIKEKYKLALDDHTSLLRTHKKLQQCLEVERDKLIKIRRLEKAYQATKKNTYMALLMQIKKSHFNVLNMHSSHANHLFQISSEGSFDNFYDLISAFSEAFPVAILSFLVQKNTSRQNLLIFMKWIVL